MKIEVGLLVIDREDLDIILSILGIFGFEGIVLFVYLL